MSCDCAYVDVDCSGIILEQRLYKARKQHQCCNCGRVIESKEEYEKAVGIWDGDFDTYKTCEACLSLRAAFFCGSYHFDFYEDLRNHIDYVGGQISSDCILSLTPKAKDFILDLIDEYFEYYDD